MKFAAVVVSYNRIELLKKCLRSLEQQTRPLDEIIVVDNGSTDGSADYVAAEHPGITLFRTGENLGGAGGFAWGVEIALAHGLDGAWLMDDDAEPELDAFKPLADRFEAARPEASFLASLVMTHDDQINKGNRPRINSEAERQVEASEQGGIAIDTATFVGVLINLHFAAKTALPMSDFFIWMDDAEYTYRLSRMANALMIPESKINHPQNPVRNDMGARLFYLVRNQLWFIRERQSTTGRDLLDAVGLLRIVLMQFFAAKDKKLWFQSAAKGLGQGVFRRPKRRKPGSLLKTLSPQERAIIGC
ncbi:glycosyltransferase [Propionibacterium freudenreichii]|uniref:glycosyltransferase family 2 protein n=1 Tax=Propionibacterium freudenreichii TaxID=1744 RepID=UPI0006DC02E2|nr:glycosyltransferase family 2 protein [Propionibacterium freudenreichii]MDK9294936.1 glycosyltransferase family 2 protein [Propionibacterium freudenreichii]MDK9318900.1 glycosyltransferase family 2 protein [Propionibacterium freudenreichii]MDK9353093.1 glycosyltransferase [Propionibacterium freudenreichii]MDK9360279.1 glycosyltransferase family 2 protein [Propionibacterium freudenreichii]MDK9620950.1 glycosyltransferase [Propionibacterium freudenreichii]